MKSPTTTFFRVIACAFALACISSPARAYIVTVNSVEYEVSTTTGTFGSLGSTLTSQPWWGPSKGPTAASFAAAVAGNLFFPNGGGSAGPFFGYDNPDYISGKFWNGSAVIDSAFSPSESITWAVARQTGSVPDHGQTLALFGAALFGMLGLRRRFG